MAKRELKEPLSNLRTVHAGCMKPKKRFTKMKPETFVGKFIKKGFTSMLDGRPGIEHMWVEVKGVERQDGESVLTGTLESIPCFEVGLQCGDAVTVKLTEIEEVFGQ
jgi:hypothetical protein